MNPSSTIITAENKDKFIQADDLRSTINNSHFDYNQTVDKKFYISMEFNKINNPEFHNEKLYSLAMTVKNKLYTPQINNVSLMMPPAPPLYQWDDIPKVNIN